MTTSKTKKEGIDYIDWKIKNLPMLQNIFTIEQSQLFKEFCERTYKENKR